MQAQAALVGADGAVELHAEAAVHLDLAVIVDPRHAEHDDALGLDDALEQRGLLVLGMGLDDRLEGLEHLGDGLDELGLVGVALVQLGDDPIGIGHDSAPQKWEFSCAAYGTTAA